MCDIHMKKNKGSLSNMDRIIGSEYSKEELLDYFIFQKNENRKRKVRYFIIEFIIAVLFAFLGFKYSNVWFKGVTVFSLINAAVHINEIIWEIKSIKKTYSKIIY